MATVLLMITTVPLSVTLIPDFTYGVNLNASYKNFDHFGGIVRITG